MGNSHQSALRTKTLIHHVVDPVHSGFEPELEFPERDPHKILWFWIRGRNPERNAIFSSDSGNIFILKNENVFRNCRIKHVMHEIAPDTALCWGRGSIGMARRRLALAASAESVPPYHPLSKVDCDQRRLKISIDICYLE